MSTSGRNTTTNRIAWGEYRIGGPRHAWRERLMWAWLRGEGGAGPILEAGAGSATLSERLVRLGRTTIALEPSNGFFADIVHRHRADGTTLLFCPVRGRLESIPLADEAVETVMCGEVLEHIVDDAAALAELARVLRPGGSLILTVPFNPRLWDPTDDLAGHHRRYTREELTGKSRSAGLAPVRLRVWGFPFMRIYHRWFYLPWQRWASGRGRKRWTSHPATRVARTSRAERFFGALFTLDMLFGRLPWGIGLIAVARKPK